MRVHNTIALCEVPRTRRLGVVLGLALFVSSCAVDAFNRVRDANTLEAARQKLNGFEPKVTRYGANAEAWYFDDSHRVLFVDGVVRISTSARATSEGSKFQLEE